MPYRFQDIRPTSRPSHAGRGLVSRHTSVQEKELVKEEVIGPEPEAIEVPTEAEVEEEPLFRVDQPIIPGSFMHETLPEEEDVALPSLSSETEGDTSEGIVFAHPESHDGTDPAPVEWYGYGRPKFPTAHREFGGWKWILSLLVVAGVVGGGLFLFSGATVSVVPRQIPFDGAVSLLAKRDPGVGDLPFSIMKVSQKEEKEVAANGMTDARAKASAEIVIYNAFDTHVQRLIKNTRFMTGEGKIYRIAESVNVPGLTKNGSTVVPGSVSVTVYADEAGPAYNGPATDLSIPGLKGDPREGKVYARAKSAFVGGAEGTRPVVADADLAAAKDAARASLEGKLREQMQGELTPEQVAYAGGAVIAFADPVIAMKDGGKAVVTITGTLSTPVFDRAVLARVFAAKVAPKDAVETTDVPNLASLTFAPLQPYTAADLDQKTELAFTLSGKGAVVWSPDAESIKRALVGKDAGSFVDILRGIPGVESGTAEFRPTFMHTFSTNPNRIHVDIEAPRMASSPVDAGGEATGTPSEDASGTQGTL